MSGDFTDSASSRKKGAGPLWAAMAAVSLLILSLCVAALTWTGIQRAQQGTETAERTETLTVPVRTQQLQETQSGTLSISYDGALPVLAPAGIITASGAQDGQQLRVGDTLAVIDQYPMLLFTGTVPAYRALGPGVTGDDAAQLQDNLAQLGYSTADARGTYGKSTAQAVARMIHDRGYLPKNREGEDLTDSERWDEAGLPAGTFMTVPQEEVTVLGSCGEIGQRPEGPICSLRTAGPQAHLKLPEGSPAPPEGAEVRFTQEGQQITASLGERQGERYRIPQIPQDMKPAEDLPATVVIAQTEGPVLTIPLTSLSTHEGQDAVEAADGTWHAVTLGTCIRGYCELLQAEPELSEGAELKVHAP